MFAVPLAPSQADVTPRIIGGAPIEITDAPWQVALLYAGTGSVYQRQFCGGSILDAEWIITAADCLAPVVSLESIEVLSGTALLNGSGTESTVRAIRIHPDFDSSSGANNIALVQLSSALTLGPTRQPISLPELPDWPASGSPAVITGWGSIRSTEGDYPTQLRQASIQVIGSPSSPDCGLDTAREYDSAVMLCAGPETGSVDTCWGDMGGPLKVTMGATPILAGIANRKVQCAQPGYPGIYTRVSSFVSWIEAARLPIETGQISVTVTGRLPEETEVCAWAFNPRVPNGSALAGACSDTRTATISNLPPGDYQVRVTTANDYSVASWWNRSGPRLNRSDAETVAVAAGTTSPLDTTLPIGGALKVNVSPNPRSDKADVCFYVYPVGNSEYLDYNCIDDGSFAADGLIFPGLPPGKYQVQAVDRLGHYRTQWYLGLPTRTRSPKTDVYRETESEISFNVAKPGSRPAKVRNLRWEVSASDQGYTAYVSWEEPFRDGNATITGYRVSLLRGQKVLATEITRELWAVSARLLDRGTKYTMTVSAISAGVGTPAVATFTTPK